MRFESRYASALLGFTVLACGDSAGSKASPDAALDARHQGGRSDAAAGDSGSPKTPMKDSGGRDGVANLGKTPILWADAWVKGFYGTAYAGVDVYSNTDTAGPPDGYYTAWRGDPGVSLFGNVSDCSSFSDTLLARSYGWVPATTNPRPLAEDYYWAVRSGAGFSEIDDVHAIEAGDVLVLLYPPGGTDTGHVAWVDAAPQPFAGAPDEEGLSGFAVTVIDSTNGFHDGPSGPSSAADDRYLGTTCTSDTDCITLYGPNALCNTTQLIDASVCSLMGVGRGQMRLYADSTGTLQGHSWSPNVESTFYLRPSPLPVKGGTFTGEDIVIGRYNRK